MKNYLILATLIGCFFLNVGSISSKPVTNEMLLYKHFLLQSTRKLTKYNNEIENSRSKYFIKLQKAELGIKNKLRNKKPELSDYLFSTIQLNKSPYFAATNDKSIKSSINSGLIIYDANFDEKKNTLKYLIECVDIATQYYLKDEIYKAAFEIRRAEHNRELASNAKTYIRNRKEQFKKYLGANPEIEFALLKYNKVAYYYITDIKESEDQLSISTRLENKTYEHLRKFTDYNEFLTEKSELKRFTTIPKNWGDNIQGLQTNNQTNSFVENSVTNLGPNALQIIEKNMSEMYKALTNLKNDFQHINNAGDLPEFKPKPLKTKKLKERLRYGFNYQINQSNYSLPNSGSLNLQISYLITLRSSFGVGVAYLIGFGSIINRIQISQEGIGFRTSLEYRIKGSVNLIGEFVENYSLRANSRELNSDPRGWNPSALFGLKLRYQIAKNKSTTMSIMYNFLHENGNPQSSALVYRFGWEFN